MGKSTPRPVDAICLVSAWYRFRGLAVIRARKPELSQRLVREMVACRSSYSVVSVVIVNQAVLACGTSTLILPCLRGSIGKHVKRQLKGVDL